MDIGARPSILIAAALGLVAFLLIFDRESDDVAHVQAVPAKAIKVVNGPPPREPAATLAPASAATPRSNDNSPLPTLRPVAINGAVPFDGRALAPLAHAEKAMLNGRAVHRLGADAVSRKAYRASMGPILAEQGAFVLVPPTDAAQDPIARGARTPAFLNDANGRVEILSGTLAVKLNNLEAAPLVATRFGLTLLTQQEAISRAYYRVPDGFNFNADLGRIRADPDVLDIEVGVLRGKVETR